RVDPGRRRIFGLATMAFAVSAGAAAILTVLGIAAGLVYSPDFELRNGILNVGLSIAIGLSLYWLLLGEGVRQARLAGIVAFVAGSVNSVLAVVWRATQLDGLGTIAATAGSFLLTLWLALFPSGYAELRL